MNRPSKDLLSRFVASPAADPVLRDWFALHTQSRFRDGATWLARELDAQAESGTDADAESFRRAIELEIAFHTAPLKPRAKPQARPAPFRP
jgi:thiaminase